MYPFNLPSEHVPQLKMTIHFVHHGNLRQNYWSRPNGPHTSMSSSDLKDMMKRPTKVMRRRSTRVYHLGASEDTVFRQKRWEKVVETRLVDIFFTIHRNRTGTPP